MQYAHLKARPLRAPLGWDEVNDSKLDARRSTIKNIFQRLSQKPDPWKNLRHSARSLKAACRQLDAMFEKECKE
jgi:DNA primase